MTSTDHRSWPDELRRDLGAIWIATNCPTPEGGHIVELEVTGSGGGDTWSRLSRLEGRTGYYRQVRLDGRRASRLSIAVVGVDGRGPGCVSEARVEPAAP